MRGQAQLVRLADYRRGTWGAVDETWETTTLGGVERLLDGDRAAAGALLARALRLAEAELARDDPRRAAALTNVARLRTRAAAPLLDAAVSAWADVPGWVDRLAVGDATLGPAQCLRLAEEGRRHAEALAARRPVLLPCGLARWRARRMTAQDDRRKLLAAVFLSTFRLAAQP
jgi:hypothetical protein